jgi:hypothetical protein
LGKTRVKHCRTQIAWRKKKMVELSRSLPLLEAEMRMISANRISSSATRRSSMLHGTAAALMAACTKNVLGGVFKKSDRRCDNAVVDDASLATSSHCTVR